MKKTIKEQAIENGVGEWYFDEISDECLSEYTLQDIMDSWEESQNI